MERDGGGSFVASAREAEIHPLVESLQRRDALSLEEKQVLENLPWRLRSFEAGEEILPQGARPNESCLVIQGFASRTRSASDGARQISAFYLPGNFVDLHCLLLKQIDYSVAAVTKCRVGFVPHEALQRVTENFPHLMRLLWTLTEIDGSILLNWVFQLGRRSALQRLAHLVCEMFCRLDVVGLASGHGFLFPVNQADLGDMLGLSTVHTNRTVQELRATGLLTWQRHSVTIKDWAGLVRLAEFDPIYLHLVPEPR